MALSPFLIELNTLEERDFYSPSRDISLFMTLKRILRSPRFLIPSVRCPIIAIMLSATRPARIYIYIGYSILCVLMLSVSFGHHPAQCAQWLHSPGSRNRDQGAGRRSLSKWLHLRAEHETLTHTHPYSTINTAYRETTTQERQRERVRHTLTQAVGGARRGLGE